MYDTAWKWYISQFPESLFPCPQQNIEPYVAGLIQGKDIASHRNVLICGIVRNSAKILPYTIARIERLGSYFKNYHVFLFENDSIDSTKKILTEWKNTNNKINFKSDTFNPPPFIDPHGQDRRYFMAKARNEYLLYAKSYIIKNSIDYVIILDMDLLGGWSYHGILHSIGQGEWDVIASNSLYYTWQDNKWQKLFYDSWALRPLDHPQPLEDNVTNLFVFNRGEPMLQVNSCFGGLAIYKPYFLNEDLGYDDTDCDHPTLHNQLVRRGYHIFMNPSQITLYNKSQYVI